MASKKREISLKKKLQCEGPVQMKRPSKAHDEEDDDDDDDDEGVLEMERNFALFNKRRPEQKSDMTEKDEEESSDDEPDEVEDEEHDHGEDLVKERVEAESLDTTESQESQRRRNESTDLSMMSFEEILSLQSRVGTKACNKLIREAKKKKQNSEPAKPVTRDRPQEISAKRPVSFLRKAGSIKKPISRDPRFDDLSGEFKADVFNQTYKFINDIRHREAEMVRKKLKKVKSDAKKEELKSFLKRMENQKRNHQRQEQRREKELCYKRKQRALVGDGHRPFYLKKSDQKKLQLAEKYAELKKSGKLENFLSKKRKRNAVKDRRKLP